MKLTKMWKCREIIFSTSACSKFSNNVDNRKYNSHCNFNRFYTRMCNLCSHSVTCYVYRCYTSVIRCGCGTWSFIILKEYRLRMFRNWVRRRGFGSKRKDIRAKLRKLHNKKPHNIMCVYVCTMLRRCVRPKIRRNSIEIQDRRTQLVVLFVT
jgi:hypothetical protein